MTFLQILKSKATTLRESTLPTAHLLQIWQIIFFGVVIVFIHACRNFSLVIQPVLWAEDGIVFLKNAYELGTHSLLLPYAGYLHLVPRTVALFSTFLPLQYVPLAFVSSALLVHFCVALHLFGSRIPLKVSSKILFGLASALVPHSGEVFLNLTNVQWFLALGCILLILSDPPLTKLQGFFDFLFITFAAFTGPFMAIFVPTYFLKIVFFKSKSKSELTRFSFVFFLCVLHALFTNYNRAQIVLPFQFQPDIWSKLLQTYWMSWMYPGWVFGGPWGVLFWQSVAFTFAFFFAVHLLLNDPATRKNTFVILFCSGSILTAVLWTSMRGANFEIINPFGFGGRYFFIPYVCMAWMGILLFESSAVRSIKVSSAYFLVAALCSSLHTFERNFGKIPKDFKIQVEEFKKKGTLTFEISPPGWGFELAESKYWRKSEQ